MTRYSIFDRDETPQGFPLSRLLLRVRDVVPDVGEKLLVRRCQGYGVRINQLARATDELGPTEITWHDLETLAEGVDEWFYDVDIEDLRHRVLFGIHDSTCLFVEADEGMASAIASAFVSTKVAGPYRSST